ncbi:uracil-DNA glycosylase family protein [uncultured Sphingomonas sp.]|uniref:uracil-DNA glycosylase family protein n=1 Tax=uncultured Sphingomonas sp. TaxID=158754 RepID=UPI0035C9D809
MGADQNPDLRASIASALDWWRDAGVDCEIDDAPRDWLARRAAPIVTATSAAGTLPDTLAAFAAWRIGGDVPEAGWPGAPIAAQGDPASDLMVVVDLPDRDDVTAGLLMTGPVGILFDAMLKAIGRDRSSIYLASIAVKRPPAGRIGDDIGVILAALMRHHIALVSPKRVLALGNAASRALVGADAANARGSSCTLNHERGTSEVVASFHPRFLRERPAAKADAWRDLQLLIGSCA